MPAVKIDFPENDSRLTIDETANSGTFEGKAVVLVDVNEDQMKVGRSGSRHVEIYKRISVGTLVQSFYGICERKGKKFAVLEDLGQEPNLATTIRDNLLPTDGTSCLRIAYDLANTVAYFHSAGIVIKSLSDVTVVLKTLEGGSTQPCLTNIETARTVTLQCLLWQSSASRTYFFCCQIFENTALVEYDVRFEAPEYAGQSVHTKQTDVWR
jgi:hypothetical protein